MRHLLLCFSFVISATVSSFSGPQPDPKWANFTAIKSVKNLVFAGEHEFYAFGDFDSIGHAPAPKFAKWTEHGWQGFASASHMVWKSVYATAVDKNGTLFMAGECEKSYASAAFCFEVWDGLGWRSLSLGSDGRVYAMAADQDRNVFIGGAFSTIQGFAANSIAKWDGFAWSALGAGVDSTVRAIAVGSDSALLVASTTHTSERGTATLHVGKWTGSWNAVTTDSILRYDAVLFGRNGEVFAAGTALVPGVWPEILQHYANGKWDTLHFDSGVQESGGSFLVDGQGTLWACPLGKWDGRTAQACALPQDFSSATVSPSGAVAAAGASGVYLWSQSGWQTMGGILASGAFENMSRDASGNTYLSMDSLVFAYDGLTFRPLGSKLPGHITGLGTGPKGELFASGRYGTNDSGFVQQWNGQAWAPLGGRSLKTPVAFMAIDPNGKVFVVTSIYAERWDDTGWTKLGTAFNGDDLRSVISFDKSGKAYKTDNGTILAKNDTGWSVPEFWGKPGVAQRYLASEIFFDPSGNAYIIVAEPPAAVSLPGWSGFSVLKWDGATLKELGGFTSTSGKTQLYSHAFDTKGNLYIAGMFTQVYTSTTAFVASKGIAKWDGTAWSPLGTGITNRFARPYVSAVAVDARDNVYVAGLFEMADGISCPNFSIYNADGFSGQTPVRIGFRPGSASAAAEKTRVNVSPGLLRFRNVLPKDRIFVYALNGKRLLESAGKPEIPLPAATRQPLLVRVVRGKATLFAGIVMP